MKKQNNRRLKVYGQSNGFNREDVPTIILKGKWLEATGFDIGTNLLVECEDGKLTISALERKFDCEKF